MNTVKHMIRWCVRHVYTSVTFAFFVWVVFFDNSNLYTQLKIIRKIYLMECDIASYSDKVHELKSRLFTMCTLQSIEKIARENFYMHKANEKIILVDD